MSSLCQVRADTNLVIETFFSICFLVININLTMDYEVGLLECAARNNPQASRSVQKLPHLIITTIFPAVLVGFHPTVGFYPTANFIQLWISRYQHYFFDCHKDIALALQLIHNKKCRLNTGSIFIMQQDNRIFPRFGQDSLFNIGAA